MFQNKLSKYFLIWFGAMVIILAVTFPEHRPVDFTQPRFRVAQPDLLYFKNLRAYYYFQKEDEPSGYNLLTFKSFYKDSANVPNLTFTLLHNWRQDEAYVVAQWKDTMVFKNPLNIKWRGEEGEGEFTLEEFNNEAHFKFAGEVYSHLIKNHHLDFNNEPIYTTAQSKSAIKTLKDYFKLVGKIY